MIHDFLSPLPESFIAWTQKLPEGALGRKIQMYQHELPDLEECKVAIVSIEESRGGSNGEDCNGSANAIRRELYELFAGHWDLSIIDAGSIIQGDTKEDSYLALSTVVTYCVKNQVIPIIIGGTQDLTFALYTAFDHLEQSVNIASVDCKFDLGERKLSESHHHAEAKQSFQLRQSRIPNLFGESIGDRADGEDVFRNLSTRSVAKRYHRGRAGNARQ
jgi:hypothetical protein